MEKYILEADCGTFFILRGKRYKTLLQNCQGDCNSCRENLQTKNRKTITQCIEQGGD